MENFWSQKNKEEDKKTTYASFAITIAVTKMSAWTIL